jgi:class 3 adenylate cyclase
VKEDFYGDSKVVGFVFAPIRWSQFFDNALPESTKGIVVEVTGECWTGFSFRIERHTVEFLGYGNQPSAAVDGHLRHMYEFAGIVRGGHDSENGTKRDDHDPCALHLTAYATGEFESSCTTNKPALYTTAVVLVFFITIATFAFYDYWVNRRQRLLLARAKRTDAIVSRMFPKQIQKRILEEAEAEDEAETNKRKWRGLLAPKNQLKEFLNEGTSAHGREGAPIADMFPETSLMFADIAGFTQWSSCRVPSDVFVLLEAVFAKFDEIASRRRVFKVWPSNAAPIALVHDMANNMSWLLQVETVGDCYVAVSGLPEPRKDHALVMARFARDCLYSFNTVVKQLETTLGPDTGELGYVTLSFGPCWKVRTTADSVVVHRIRIGLHSGPVTAGVLRGERARFQLFGGKTSARTLPDVSSSLRTHTSHRLDGFN